MTGFPENESRPCCLTIAGSDSGGNAGVQADLRAFHAYGLHGCTVFAALTAQNPFSVSAVLPVPSPFVKAQLEAVLGVYSIRAAKTGMLADPSSIEVIAALLSSHSEIACVVDPVMVATSGARLVSEEASEAARRLLMPIAALVTPNLPEAEMLCGFDVSDPNAMRSGSASRAAELARRIYDEFGCPALVKGGHGAESTAVDVLFDGREIHEFSLPWIDDPVSTHGTGCSLSAALAAELALGRGVCDAVAGAKQYVHDAVSGSYLVGDKCGVLDFAWRRANG